MVIGSFVKWADSKRQQQLRIGQKVEMEHTDSPRVARRIATDHMNEIDDYYTRLTKMERQAKREGHGVDGAEKKSFVEYFREKKAGLEHLPAQMVGPEIERRTEDELTQLLNANAITPEQAEKLRVQVASAAAPLQRGMEAKAFRREAGERTLSPTTVGTTATALGIGTVLPIGVNRIHRLWNKDVEKMPWREAFKMQFLPSMMPWTAGFEGLSHALAPMSDPMYRRGERGYFRSMGESFRGAQEGLAERGAETRERLGVLGMPVQAFHGIMNPMASIANAGRQLKNTVIGTPPEDLLREAMERVAAANARKESA